MTEPRYKRSRPLAGAAISKNVQAGGPNKSIVAQHIPALHELSARGREIVLAHIEAAAPGLIEIGRRQVEDEVAAEWQLIRDVTMPVALREPFDLLAERRGQHERAEASRELLRSRGVVA